MTARYGLGVDGTGFPTVTDSESDRVIPFGSDEDATLAASLLNLGAVGPGFFSAISAEYAAAMTDDTLVVPAEHVR